MHWKFQHILISGTITAELQYLKDKIYRTPPQDINDLGKKIQLEADALHGNPELIRRVARDMQRRSDLCVLRNGGHVE
jgi:hypothetical protein